MNTHRLWELRGDLRRLQYNIHTLEAVLKGFDATQKERYEKNIRTEIFQAEETYCDAMEEISEIKAFLVADRVRREQLFCLI